MLNEAGRPLTVSHIQAHLGGGKIGRDGIKELVEELCSYDILMGLPIQTRAIGWQNKMREDVGYIVCSGAARA